VATPDAPGCEPPPPSHALDRVFRVSLGLKGIDGLLEAVGGIALLVVSPRSLDALARTLAQHELTEDPHDFIARHVLRASAGLRDGMAVYAGVYLLAHGVAKVVLVVEVLRDRLWAYPAMIALLAAFIGYQLYRLSYDPTLGLTLLTVFDGFVVWLTAREYRSKRRRDDGSRRRWAMLGPWPPRSDPGSPFGRW